MRTSIVFAIILAPFAVANAQMLNQRQMANSSASSTTSSAGSLATSSLARNVNSSAYDLTQHFCRLWRHASVYVNGSIYIDSGDTYTPQGNTTFSNTLPGLFDEGMNVNLLVIDLSQNFTANDTFQYRTIHKPPGVPPALEDSALWYSQTTRKLYQLGGWFSRSGTPSTAGYVQTPSIPPAAIWEYDIDTGNWAQETEFQDINTGEKIDRPGAAAHCDAPTLNQSFIFEGFVQQLTDPAYINYTLYDTFGYIEGMLQLDTSTPSLPTLTNITIPTFLGPRTDGSMIHVPVGPKGVLVLIGGQTTQKPNTPWGVPVPGASGGNIMVNMTSVDLYDIESGYWFRQQTFDSGDGIPSGRGALCLALISAADGSSWNIIMVGGVLTFASDGATPNQEIWALSLPTFNWVRLHTQLGGLYRHTCHLVGENLLIIGGMERIQPAGNADAKYCQSSMPARIFSMPQMNYTDQFDYPGSLRQALVPNKIISVIGGSSSGGAPKTQPISWNDVYLQQVFNPALPRTTYRPPASYVLASNTNTTNTTNTTNITTSATTSTPTATTPPTPTHSPSKSHTGAIAGGVVGGVAGLAILGLLVWLIRRRKQPSNPDQPPELPSYHEAKEIAERDHARSVPIEMPTPGAPPVGWHDERFGEGRDGVAPLVGGGHGLGLSGADGGPRTESRFSEVSDDTTVGNGSANGASPRGSPRIPRKEVGSLNS